jgi:hypothetical protein
MFSFAMFLPVTMGSVSFRSDRVKAAWEGNKKTPKSPDEDRTVRSPE